MTDGATRERARQRASVIDGWARFRHLDHCREAGCEGAPVCVVVYRIGDELGVTTLCAEHEVAADEFLRERPRMQLKQSTHDDMAKEGRRPAPTGEEKFLRDLASEFFYEDTFDKLIAASSDPATVVIADELKRRADALRNTVMPGGNASR